MEVNKKMDSVESRGYNTNGRAGDVEFAKAVYSLLINGEHLNTRKLRLLVQDKLKRDVATQKIAQFVFNKKANGILALDDEKNNYLTEQGIEEARKLLGACDESDEPVDNSDNAGDVVDGVSDNGNIDNGDIDNANNTSTGTNDGYKVIYSENKFNSKPAEVLDRLSKIRDGLGRELLQDGSELNEIFKLIKIYKELGDLIKQNQDE